MPKKVPEGINFIHPYTRTLFDFNSILPASFYFLIPKLNKLINPVSPGQVFVFF